MDQENREPLTDDINPIFINSPDNKYFNLIVYKNDIIEDDNGIKYQILSKLGEGQFGQVFAVSEITSTNQEHPIYALKITKSHSEYRDQAQKEADLMKYISEYSSDDEMEHIIRFIRSFIFKNHLVILTEILSMNLMTIIEKKKYIGLPLNLIQSIVRTILEALSTLLRLGIVHSDVKPENILLVNGTSTKFKIVDFGSSRFISQQCTFYIQSRFYRAPEVILSIPHSYPIDIWSLGCVAVELFVGLPLFPGENEVQMIILISRMLGQIPQNMIDISPRKNIFFNPDNSLKTESEICSSLKIEVVELQKYFYLKKLPDIIMYYSHNIGITTAEQKKENWRRKLFVDLLTKMLTLDPQQRISPNDALQHPFITTDLHYS